MTANELIGGWRQMAGHYRYGNKLSGCIKVLDYLGVY